MSTTREKELEKELAHYKKLFKISEERDEALTALEKAQALEFEALEEKHSDAVDEMDAAHEVEQATLDKRQEKEGDALVKRQTKELEKMSDRHEVESKALRAKYDARC